MAKYQRIVAGMTPDARIRAGHSATRSNFNALRENGAGEGGLPRIAIFHIYQYVINVFNFHSNQNYNQFYPR